MYQIQKYFEGVMKQGKMVRWPSAEELFGYFAVVVSVVVFSAVACSIDDFIIVKILGVLDANLGSSSSAEGGEVAQAIKTLCNLIAMR